MKKGKYVAIALAVFLVIGLLACNQQAEQVSEEPSQEVQQSEPVATEPAVQPLGVTATDAPEPEELEVTEPVEVKESDPVEEPTSEEPVAPVEPAEPVTPVEPVASVAPVDPAELFTDCNDVVYATGTVNIRASWSASSEKLGSMSIGESVTRTGMSIAGTEAEGWSRVSLADGTIAYMSNSLLSTTKPVTTNNGGGTGGGAPSGNPTDGGDTGGGAPSSSPNSTAPGRVGINGVDGWYQDVYDYLNAEQRAIYDSMDPMTRETYNHKVRQRKAEEEAGWTTNTGADPDDWNHIRVTP